MKRNSQSGFTLLEVLVAASILSIAIAVVLQLFSADLRAIAVSERYAAVAVKADAKMRELLNEESLEPGIFNETTSDGYEMNVSISDTLQERTENLAVVMREILLTVAWRDGTKEKSMTLKSMKMVKKEI